MKGLKHSKHFFFSSNLLIFTFYFNFQQNFIRFLENNRPRFSKLQTLTLQLNKVPAGMTAQTAIAILRNSDLDEFNCFTPLPFTVQNQVEDLIKNIVSTANI